MTAYILWRKGNPTETGIDPHIYICIYTNECFLGSQRDLQQQSITMESRKQRRFGTQQKMMTSINIKHVLHLNTMIFSPPLGTKIRVSAGIKVNFNPKKDA